MGGSDTSSHAGLRKPTTDMSRGTDSPRWCMTLSTPRAPRELDAKIAVTSGYLSRISLVAVSPQLRVVGRAVQYRAAAFGQPEPSAGFLETLDSVGGSAQPLRPGNDGDAAVPEIGQVPDHFHAASLVVAKHAVHPSRVRAARVFHYGDLRSYQPHRVGALGRPGHVRRFRPALFSISELSSSRSTSGELLLQHSTSRYPSVASMLCTTDAALV